MTLTPLLESGAVVKWHAVSAIAASAIGSLQVLGPKGTKKHRVLGYFWAALMMWVAGSSLWIHQFRIIGPWSPIHLLSLLVLVTVPLAVWHAHAHRVAKHRSVMLSLFVLALVLTGIFTLLPGRVMHEVIFGG